jgi:hypothetical protein
MVNLLWVIDNHFQEKFDIKTPMSRLRPEVCVALNCPSGDEMEVLPEIVLTLKAPVGTLRP